MIRLVEISTCFLVRAGFAALLVLFIYSTAYSQQITCPVTSAITNTSATATNSLKPCQIDAGATLTNSDMGTLENKPGAVLLNNGNVANDGTLLNDSSAIISNGAASVIENSGTLTNNGKLLTETGGSLSNSGTISNSGSFAVYVFQNSSSGTVNNGGTFLQAEDLSNQFTNSGAFNNSGTLSAVNFSNSGTLTNTGTATLAVGLPGNGNSGLITNKAGGQMTLAGGFLNSPGGTLNNMGTLLGPLSNLTGGTVNNAGVFEPGILSNSGAFNNSGTLATVDFSNSNGGVLVNTGTATLGTEGFPGEGNSGVITNKAGAQMTLVGGFENLQGATLTNEGTLTGPLSNLMGGTVNNAGNFQPGDLNNSGAFNNSGSLTTVNFNNSSGGVLINTGTAALGTEGAAGNAGLITNAVGAQMTLTGGYQNEAGGILNNLGTLSGPLVNLAGGTVNNTGNFQPGVLSNFGVLNNSGTLTTADFFNSAGAVLINSGTFTLTAQNFPGNNTGEITNTGTLKIAAGATLNNLAGSSYVQTSGRAIVDGTLNSVPAVQIQGGILSGSGTIGGSVLNSGGVVRPGDDGVPGTLIVTTSYEQEAGATFDEVIGASGNGQLDALTIQLDPGAKLMIDLLNGFTPTEGETFTIMEGLLVTGTFSNAPTTGFEMDGFDWTIAYEPGEIILDAGSPVNSGGGGGGTSVPEPSSMVLFAIGIAALGACSRRGRGKG